MAMAMQIAVSASHSADRVKVEKWWGEPNNRHTKKQRTKKIRCIYTHNTVKQRKRNPKTHETLNKHKEELIFFFKLSIGK